MVTHLGSDILEHEVRWALGSPPMNKASGGDGIPAELFQILKGDAAEVLHSIYKHIWKTQQWPQDWKRSVFIPIPREGNAKECSNYHTIVLISHVSSKSFKPYFQMYKLDLEKAEDSETKLPTSVGSYKKQENSRKTSASLTTQKPLIVWIRTNC